MRLGRRERTETRAHINWFGAFIERNSRKILEVGVGGGKTTPEVQTLTVLVKKSCEEYRYTP